MRHIACRNTVCVNAHAPFFDFEQNEIIVLCPVCGAAMAAATLADLETKAADKTAADAAAVEAEAAAAPTPSAPAPDPLVEKLKALGDQTVTASDLLAILRPDTMTADAHPTTTEEPGRA